ncbi:MAG: glycoside hydrolase, partial [Verrucomicrobiae bacterium]|nr:glycoside hydrolase [Verrucomicrobiae bacterium]
IQAWGAGLKSRINALPPETRTDYRAYVAARKVPVISHEIGHWCVYPNFDEVRKYTGYLKPKNFEIFKEKLSEHGMLHQARPFLLASGKLQVLCYKEEIESALRTPGMGGFQLLDLHDFPGQGTALVGVLDPFWEEKGYVTAREFRRFCGPTVLLARMEKRVFTQSEHFNADIEIAHFGPVPIHGSRVRWRFVNDAGRTIRSGTLPYQVILTDNAIPLGRISFGLGDGPAPARYKLVASLDRPRSSAPGLPRQRIDNDWDVWIYPRDVDQTPPSSVRIVNHLDEQTAQYLQSGGTVLWLLPPTRVRPDPKLGKVELGFSSIFWNTAWTGRQAPHTLGVLCNPRHPLFAEFPTDFHSNWQWWYIVTRAGAMILDGLPKDLQPLVQVVDDWFTARKLGLVFEAKVGRGRLLVCSIDLERDLQNNPVARQFRYSLFKYITSPHFSPKSEITLDQARSLTTPPGS